MNTAEQRRANALAISFGLLLGAILSSVALALTFLATLALDIRSVATALLVPPVEIVVIMTASVIFVYKRRESS